MCQEHAVARLRPALGTLGGIEARGLDQPSISRAVAAGFEAVGGVDRRLHPTRPGSDLARLNCARAGTRVVVHPSPAAVLELSRCLCIASGGRFEPALP